LVGLLGFQKQAEQLKIFVKKMTVIIKMMSQLQLNNHYKLNHPDQLRSDLNRMEEKLLVMHFIQMISSLVLILN
jgi:hypothetical protein